MSEEEGAPKRGSRSARRAPEDRRGLLYWLGDLFANKGKELFAGFVITVFGVVTYAMWDTLQDKTRGFVVEAVLAEFDERNRLTEPIYKILQQDKAKGLVAEAILAELERDHGKFHGPIQKIFEGARQTEVGTLSAGEFVLTPTNRAYTVYVYYPEGYKGKLYYSLEGVSSPKSVSIFLPNGERGPIKKSESSIDLAKAIEPRRGALGNQGIDGVFDSTTALGDIRAFTFQLTGEETDTPPTGGTGASETERPPLISRVEVRYVSFVAPAIHIDK